MMVYTDTHKIDRRWEGEEVPYLHMLGLEQEGGRRGLIVVGLLRGGGSGCGKKTEGTSRVSGGRGGGEGTLWHYETGETTGPLGLSSDGD